MLLFSCSRHYSFGSKVRVTRCLPQVCRIKPEIRNFGQKNGAGQLAKWMIFSDLDRNQTAASGLRCERELVDLIGWNWI
jgi:hypothetical protein